METFSALLAICAGNSPVTGEFPAQRPVMRSFDALFDLHLNKRLSKQWWGWWFETPSHSLWRHCNVFIHVYRFTRWQLQYRTGGGRVNSPPPQQLDEQTIYFLVIWDTMTLMCRHRNARLVFFRHRPAIFTLDRNLGQTGEQVVLRDAVCSKEMHGVSFVLVCFLCVLSWVADSCNGFTHIVDIWFTAT